MLLSGLAEDVASPAVLQDDQFRILEAAIYARLRSQIIGKVANGGAALKKRS